MKYDLAPIRIGLYSILILFSFILFCLCAARIHQKAFYFSDYPLNGLGTYYDVGPIYDPIVVELIVTTLITIPWCSYIIVCIHKRVDTKMVSTFRGELIGLGGLWLFWIVGASIASVAQDHSLCSHIDGCGVVSAVIAFSWLGWIVLTAILAISVWFTFANKAFMEPLHGRWDPRASTSNNNA